MDTTAGTKAEINVLVADDDPEILSLLRLRLSRIGMNVHTAADGEQALALAKRCQPDVVLLDVMMPGHTGWEVAKLLRQDPQFSRLAIIILTAIGERANETTSPLYGADDFIDKPFEFSDLESRIRTVLSRRRPDLVNTP
jgi:DNA-binding response OmpR family regulator